jgi:hypothetical protein
VALCGLAALAHLLVVSVARRRTGSGLLMALGMVGRQLAAIVFWQACSGRRVLAGVFWQATTIAVAAIAAGIRWASLPWRWHRATASGSAAQAVRRMPSAGAVGLGGGVLGVSNPG